MPEQKQDDDGVTVYEGMVRFQWVTVGGMKCSQWLRVDPGYEETVAESLRHYRDAAQREILGITNTD